MTKRPATLKRFFYLLALAAILCSGCARIKYGLYDMGINHEYKKAGLCVKTLDLEGKPVSFLENTGDLEKPVIVLIHGFAANKDNWIRFAAYFTEDFHVIAVDLPGHGDSFMHLNLRYDLDDQARYLHDILGRMGIKRFHMAGNSMGGAISCLYAAAYPEQVRSLLLIDPAGFHQYDCELLRQLKAGKNPLIVSNADEFDQLMDLALEKKPFVPWPGISVMAENAVQHKTINEKVFADITGEHNYVFEDELKKITAPVLILWGAQDRLIASENALLFEKMISGSSKIILDGIGHAAMIEDPEKTAGIYMEFLAGL